VVCQRCGACCFSMTIAIRLGERAVRKPADRLCPHLCFDGPVALCVVHAEPWFSRTRCHSYGGLDAENDCEVARDVPCSLGVLVRSTRSLRDRLRHAPRASPQDLEDLGPWNLDGKP
jgi:hypothetical protein